MAKRKKTVTGRTVKDEPPPLQNIPAPTGKRGKALRTKILKGQQEMFMSDEDKAFLEECKDILARLQAGQTTVGAERDRLGHKNNSKIRKVIITLLPGGKEEYMQLVGRYSPFVHKKDENGETVAWTPDDSDVPVVTATPYAKCTVVEDEAINPKTKRHKAHMEYSDGWRTETVDWHGRVLDILVAPDGAKYVAAAGNERADLIVDHSESKTPELGKLRYRLYEESPKAKAAEKEAKANKKRAAAKKKAAVKTKAKPKPRGRTPNERAAEKEKKVAASAKKHAAAAKKKAAKKKLRRYRQWAGQPNGIPEDTTRCIESVADGGRSVLSHQCNRKRGHGPGGNYCAQHAKRFNNSNDGPESLKRLLKL